MERYLKMGYHAFKIKVGRTMDISQNPLQYARGNDLRYSYDFDLQRISAVREAIGPTGTLMIDMNCTWSVEQVLCAAPFFDSQNIYWIEEPIRSDDLRGMSEFGSSSLKSVSLASKTNRGYPSWNNISRRERWMLFR